MFWVKDSALSHILRLHTNSRKHIFFSASNDNQLPVVRFSVPVEWYIPRQIIRLITYPLTRSICTMFLADRYIYIEFVLTESRSKKTMIMLLFTRFCNVVKFTVCGKDNLRRAAWSDLAATKRLKDAPEKSSVVPQQRCYTPVTEIIKRTFLSWLVFFLLSPKNCEIWIRKYYILRVKKFKRSQQSE